MCVELVIFIIPTFKGSFILCILGSLRGLNKPKRFWEISRYETVKPSLLGLNTWSLFYLEAKLKLEALLKLEFPSLLHRLKLRLRYIDYFGKIPYNPRSIVSCKSWLAFLRSKVTSNEYSGICFFN